MKKLILALLAVGAITAANAQKNSILVYGTVGVDKHDVDHGRQSEDNHFSWHINPGVGYQFDNHWTIGLQGGYMFHRDEMKSQPSLVQPPIKLQTDMSEWTVGPFLRYTHCFNSMFAMWTQLDLNYINGKGTMDTVSLITGKINDASDDYNGFSAGITPAFAINVHDGWALNFSFGGIGYRSINWDAGTRFENEEHSFNFTFGNQFNVGISKNFGCKKKKSMAEPGMDTRKMHHDHDDDDDE